MHFINAVLDSARDTIAGAEVNRARTISASIIDIQKC